MRTNALRQHVLDAFAPSAPTRTRARRTRVLPVLVAICSACFAMNSGSAAPPPASASSVHAPVVVRLAKTEKGYQLLRDGKPYFIRGVGGDGSKQALAAAGGNSVRTWGADKLGGLLDEAHALGLTVTVGIWLGHERHGFNYNNAEQVAEQLDRVRETILRHKDHPAVLMWGLGNEMEGYERGDNAAIWSAVNTVASLAKKLDPNHPTMTVVAELGGDRVKCLHRLCPDIDIVGINSYRGVTSLGKRYREAGGEKPYVITEFGPPGVWETEKDAAGLVPELSSTQKGEFYRQAYEQAVQGDKQLCLGSYAFIWGNKQEATATWFGMLLPDGTRLAAVDVMTEMWTGKPPANKCPRIESLTLAAPELVEPGATIQATLAASDPEKEALKVRWVLQREAAAFGTGGDAEEAPPVFPDAIVRQDIRGAELKMPPTGGGYRLFAFVYDGRGGAAVANVPIRVKGEAPIPDGKRAELPLVLYDEAGRDRPPYIPSGWMGNTKSIKLKEGWEQQPHSGKTCIRVDFQAGEGWGGVVWQNPDGDWGDRPGGWDLTGATRLTFWARGEKGGEIVSFELGLLGSDKKFRDTANAKLEKIKLTTEWQQFNLDLKGKDLKRIKTGFAWTLAADGRPVTFYLDDIQYE